MKTRIALLAIAWLSAGVALAEPHVQHPRGPDMDRIALLCDLNDSQKKEVEKALDAQHEQMRAAREQARTSGERLTYEQMQALHEQKWQETVAKLQSVLDERQLEKFEALMHMPLPPPPPMPPEAPPGD